MGMRDELQQELSDAFSNDLADAVTEFAGYREGTRGEYDPVLDDYVTTPPLNYTGRGVFSNFDTRLVDGNTILNTDKNLLVLTSEVTEVPKIGDTIDDQYVIHNMSQDPAGATFTLHLRKHG